MRVSYKRAAVKDMEATRDYIAGRLKESQSRQKVDDDAAESHILAGG